MIKLLRLLWKDLKKVFIALLALRDILRGIPSLYFILKWWFTKDYHCSWKSKGILIYYKILLESFVHFLCICPLAPQPSDPTPERLKEFADISLIDTPASYSEWFFV